MSHAGGHEQSVFLGCELNSFIMQILRKNFFIVLSSESNGAKMTPKRHYIFSLTFIVNRTSKLHAKQVVGMSPHARNGNVLTTEMIIMKSLCHALFKRAQ